MAANSLREAGLCIIQQAVPDDVILAAGTQANAVTAEVMAALSGTQQRWFFLPPFLIFLRVLALVQWKTPLLAFSNEGKCCQPLHRPRD